uniref:Uncharacterized protein n=1 Tax=Glossina morsitans morsitans TaxID=37546 RepID=A0A1B0FAT0_GLOMM
MTTTTTMTTTTPTTDYTDNNNSLWCTKTAFRVAARFISVLSDALYLEGNATNKVGSGYDSKWHDLST